VTNLHVRVGLSKNPESVMASVPVSDSDNLLDIRQPYTFEFLGLEATEVLKESDIEEALLSHLQEFLLEMGKGFCFEARQKRLIIDDEYYYADLVFYHRILHCSVIVELKNDEFRHEHLGQLNAYVSYYKENEMHDGDNLPIGILLCTKAGNKMVEYALAGMDNNLFVSTYLLQLPDKSVLEQFIKRTGTVSL
jgi:predicted nuclease of restriction endonuclease-like (RecB) superfamily